MNDIEKKLKSSLQKLSKPSGSRSSSNEGNVRERILKAARDVFTVYPFKEAGTRMIAKQAGVEHPMIHYYFGSKENLFYAMAEDLYHETLSVQEAWLDGMENMSLKEGFELIRQPYA